MPYRLHAELQNTGVRCWFRPHDLPIGAKTLDVVDAAILLREKLLLILSKNAIAKIGWRTRSARCSPFFPRGSSGPFAVRIDETVVKSDEPWAVNLREQRNIGDFRRWKRK